MKIIIAGDGKVGSLLTKQLSLDGHELVVIDRNDDALESTIERYDVMSIQGNCASMSVLKSAGIQKSDLLIAATGEDEVNLLTCMTAKYMNPRIHTIARVRTPEYMETTDKMKREFALSLAVNPELQTAHEIGSLMRYPAFLMREEFANGLVEIVALKIDKNSLICDKSLIEVRDIVRCQILVCAVTRGTETFTPRGDFVLREGDRIYVTASASNLSLLLHHLKIINRKIRNVVLLGGGRIAYYLTNKLQREHISVKIIERDRERCERLADRLPNTTIVQGDVSLQSVLERECIDQADAVVSMTGMDELNVITSLYANSKNVKKVVTKLGRGENQALIENLPVGGVVCPKELCGNTILRYVRAMKDGEGAAVTIHSIAGGQAQAYEFIVDHMTPYCEIPLKDVPFKKNILITSITRNRVIEIPGGDSFYQPGDRIVVVSSSATPIKNIEDIYVRV